MFGGASNNKLRMEVQASLVRGAATTCCAWKTPDHARTAGSCKLPRRDGLNVASSVSALHGCKLPGFWWTLAHGGCCRQHGMHTGGQRGLSCFAL